MDRPAPQPQPRPRPRPADPAEAPAPTDPAMIELGRSLQLDDEWQLFMHFRSDPGGYKGSVSKYGGGLGTVGDFWSTFGQLPVPSAAFTPPHQMGVAGRSIKAYSMFRGGLEPTWEDPINASGGEIACRCHLEPAVLDELWEALVLACVGGRADGVVGVRAVDNSFKGGRETQSKIEVWYGEGAEAAARAVLGALTLTPLPEFENQGHLDKSTMERKFMRDFKRRPRHDR
jgi:hypothetical protein